LISCSSKYERHLGKWKGGDSRETMNIIFDKTNHAVLLVGDKVMGGDNWQVDGEKLECKYEIDYSKDPIWLDIIFYKYEKKEEKQRLKGIVRFLTDTKIELRLQFSPSGERFYNFDSADKSSTMIFDKVAE
jgi:hypothetical protein